MQPADTQAKTPDLSPILQAGEEVLWSKPRQRAMDHAIPPLLLGAVVLLVIYALIVWESLRPGGLGKGGVWSMLFIPGLALLCVLLAARVALRNRRTVYVLTQRRAAEGSADYIPEIHRYRSVQLPVGFIGVRGVQELESQLTLVSCKGAYAYPRR